ncbi:membrane protein, putative [Acidisarcina polymorpha]|uniref:Membrane protein, putative n=1 Tax=Acidisarcina polymorpha TaxID=2211140 RepID=A0A2Z5FUI2_9BACT|nr:O-antigen ligase family protein [Acidisarcina polymorpha]AXC10146.1 membrane protein, putative [Acidisarcina polymorpha]
MGFLPIVPMLIAAYVALRYSPARAFLQVYVPVLLLLPMYYRWVIPLLPDPTFEQATILPIAAVFLVRSGGRWKFSFADLLILCFAGCIGTSEYLNTGYNEAQNLMFDMVASVVFPYMLAKGLIEPQGLSVAFAKKIVLMFSIVSVLSIYEFRMGLTPWILMRRFYPGQGLEWVTSFRYGFARIGGPYGHAILAGLVLAVGFRVQRWLEWSAQWESHFHGLKWLRVSKARLITIALVGGIIMTMVRGPWLGGAIGACLTAVGRTRHRRRALMAIAGAIIIIGIPAASSFYSYASVGRAHAKTASQETAAYRVELMDKYLTTALKRPAWGYGRNTWPKNPTAPSIDNYYLLLCLMHGMVAVGLLVTIMVTMTVRLVRSEMRSPVSYPLGSSLGFTLAGIFVVYAVTIATVYMGLQTIPLFAIITGWSEGYLLKRYSMQLAPTVAQPVFRFRRVVL